MGLVTGRWSLYNGLMSTKTPQTLKGFRDFLPSEARVRQYLKNSIRQTFELFGFEPLETPTLEYASLLLGKYGEEADKLVYIFEDRGKRRIGLRYDQTVPTARVLANYQHQLPSYFRRYQIQNVFRAEKPQRGRYRELTHADIDIFGTTSTLADAEILACSYVVFQKLQLPQVVIKINHRQLLFDQLQPFATDQISVFSLIQSIDKLDKLSSDGVIQELVDKGLPASQAKKILETLQQTSPNNNLKLIIQQAKQLGVPAQNLQFSPTLARGLDYYTGMIFEVVLPQAGLGSLAGGGRYDHLIQTLGGPDIPAVGMAIGFDRTLEVLRQLNLLPPLTSTAQALFTILDPTYLNQVFKLAQEIRSHQINLEIYPNPQDKFRKQLQYALKKQIPYLLILGEDEVKTNQVTLKNLRTRQQETLPLKTLLSLLQPNQ